MSTLLAPRVDTGSGPSAPGRTSGRQWGTALLTILAILGALLTVLFTYRAAKAPGVYWSRVEVRFLSPQLDASDNSLSYPDSSLVLVAGAVGRMVDSRVAPGVVSVDLTLADEGIKHGWSVKLPNTGGQWSNQFIRAYLDVQAVGTTEQEVAGRMKQLLADIDSTLVNVENAQGVQPKYRVVTQASPPGTPPIYYQNGSRSRATLITFAVGALTTAFVVGGTGAWLRRRRSAAG